MKGRRRGGAEGGRRDRGSVEGRKEQGWDGVMEEEGDRKREGEKDGRNDSVHRQKYIETDITNSL